MNISNFFSIKKVLIFLSIFLLTLGSYYFYQLNLYVFQIFGLILAIPLCKRWPLAVKSSGLFGLMSLFLYIFIIYVVYIILGINNISIAKLFFPILILLCYWFISVVYFEPYKVLVALRSVLLIHCLFFFIQFIVYSLFGVFIDFLEPFTGESQRAFGGSYEISFLPRFIRSTGLFNEPGTYVTYMMIFLVIFKDLCILTNNIKLDRWWVEFFILTTTLLAFSTFGYVFLLVYAIVVYGAMKSSKLKTFLFVILLLVGSTIFYEYFQQRFISGRSDTGIEFRIFGIISFFDNLNWWEFLFGRGFFSDVVSVDGEVIVLQDIGMWFGLLYYFGIFGVLLFGFYLNLSIGSKIRRISNNSYLICLLFFLLLSKLVITSILVLVVLFYISIRLRIFNYSNKISI